VALAARCPALPVVPPPRTSPRCGASSRARGSAGQRRRGAGPPPRFTGHAARRVRRRPELGVGMSRFRDGTKAAL